MNYLISISSYQKILCLILFLYTLTWLFNCLQSGVQKALYDGVRKNYSYWNSTKKSSTAVRSITAQTVQSLMNTPSTLFYLRNCMLTENSEIFECRARTVPWAYQVWHCSEEINFTKTWCNSFAAAKFPSGLFAYKYQFRVYFIYSKVFFFLHYFSN